MQLPAWEVALAVTEWRRENGRWHCLPGAAVAVEEGDAANYLACVVGLRDYIDKERLSRAWCSVFQVGSTPRCVRRWPWMRLGPTACIA